MVDHEVGPQGTRDLPHVVEEPAHHGPGGAPGPDLAGEGVQRPPDLGRLEQIADVDRERHGRQAPGLDHGLEAAPRAHRDLVPPRPQRGAQRDVGLDVAARAEGEDQDPHRRPYTKEQ